MCEDKGDIAYNWDIVELYNFANVKILLLRLHSVNLYADAHAYHTVNDHYSTVSVHTQVANKIDKQEICFMDSESIIHLL